MYVERFENISKDDIGIAGGKGANLGELTQAGIPVPPGFVITAETYQKFMESTGIFQSVMDILDTIDINKTKELQEAAEEIKQIIIDTPIPEDITTLIIEAYNALSQRVGVDDADVAKDHLQQQKIYLMHHLQDNKILSFMLKEQNK